MSTKSAIKPFMNELNSKVFPPIVERIMSEHYSAPPPNSLNPVNIWKEKIRNELTELYSSQTAIDRSARGFDAIADDLRKQLGHNDFVKISEEWASGVEKWIAFVKSENSDTDQTINPAECLQEMMGISEETINHFYEAGNRYFSHHQFEKAANAFFVVVSLDHRRYNAWIAFGLSEMNNKHWDQALYSFAMATMTNIDSPYPYMYSADCCLQSHRVEEAKVYLNLSIETLEKSGLPNKNLLMNSVMKLQHSLK